MDEHPDSPNGVVHPSVKYEPTDLSLRAILTFSAALVAALAVVVAGLFLMVWMFLGTPPRPEPVERWDFKGEPGPNPNSSYLPAKPELEAIDQNTPLSEGDHANTRSGATASSIPRSTTSEPTSLSAEFWASPGR